MISNRVRLTKKGFVIWFNVLCCFCWCVPYFCLYYYCFFCFILFLVTYLNEVANKSMKITSKLKEVLNLSKKITTMFLLHLNEKQSVTKLKFIWLFEFLSSSLIKYIFNLFQVIFLFCCELQESKKYTTFISLNFFSAVAKQLFYSFPLQRR